MNKTLRSVMSYVGINGAFAALAYYGVMVGIPWCANFFMFGVWLFTALSVFGFLAMFLVTVLFDRGDFKKDKQLEYMESRKGSFMFPYTIDILYDVSMITFLVYFGWLGYASLYLIQGICTFCLKKMIKSLEVKIRKSMDDDLERRGGIVEPSGWDSDDDDDLRRMGVID